MFVVNRSLCYIAPFVVNFRAMVLLFIFFHCCPMLQAQDSIVPKSSTDSVPAGFMQKMQQFAQEMKLKSLEDRTHDKASIMQDMVLENIKKTMQHTKALLKSGIDTTGISNALENTIRWQAIAGDGIFINKGTSQTFRNLTTTYNLLLVLESRLMKRKANLDNVRHRLSLFKFQIDSLASDSSLFSFPGDSAAVVTYLGELSGVAIEMAPMDSMQDKAIANVRALQTRVNMQLYRIASSKEEIELYQREVYRNTLRREFANIWGPVGYNRAFHEIAAYSKAKGLLTLRFYAEGNLGKICILILLTGIATIYLRSLRKVYQQKGLLHTHFEGQLVLRYPVLSAAVIILNLAQFLFPAPPFIFTAILWTIAAISLTIVYDKFISPYWMRVWLILLLLFLLASIDNLILQAVRWERWFMLILAFTGMLITLVTLKKRYTEQLKEQWIVYAIGLLGILSFLSIVTNCYGRYNLSKALLISGYSNVVVAILFLWTVRLINEALGLAFNVYSGQDRKLFYINFERVGNRAHPLFYIFMMVGWFILFGRNFYAFRLLATPIEDYLSKERQVGDYTFSINTLLLFVLIMAISVAVSRIVSYFASDKHLPAQAPGHIEEKYRIGSWLLLVRISIISLGLFFAFAAAGIPMDKIAIILGALGVGIGFGLQTLVNNLVSGLIIAFEKPVNVGDLVEIDNQAGTMKSIGFRSSIVTTWDGADMVMPNGDLLSAHLINWTLGGNKRRMNLILGVAYGTDLVQTRDLLLALMDKDERILKYPAPAVLFQEFGSSSIDIKLLFWVRYLKDGFPTRSDLIIAIYTAFKEHDITIPFPQQDIHFKHPMETKNVERKDDEEDKA